MKRLFAFALTAIFVVLFSLPAAAADRSLISLQGEVSDQGISYDFSGFGLNYDGFIGLGDTFTLEYGGEVIGSATITGITGWGVTVHAESPYLGTINETIPFGEYFGKWGLSPSIIFNAPEFDVEFWAWARPYAVLFSGSSTLPGYEYDRFGIVNAANPTVTEEYAGLFSMSAVLTGWGSSYKTVNGWADPYGFGYPSFGGAVSLPNGVYFIGYSE
jgi:hypothetical protein